MFGCFNTRNNHYVSNSIEESVGKGMFIDSFKVNLINLGCQANFEFDVWLENAWKPSFFFKKNSVERLDFKNLYFKTSDSRKVKNFQFSILDSNVWTNSTFLVEPKHGYYFVLDSELNLHDLQFRFNLNKDDCIFSIPVVTTQAKSAK